eukprot:2338777-Rhodomonas_salina.1
MLTMLQNLSGADILHLGSAKIKALCPFCVFCDRFQILQRTCDGVRAMSLVRASTWWHHTLREYRTSRSARVGR